MGLNHGDNPSDFTGNDLPVERVSWNDVQVFINKLNDRDKPVRYRLPTESEWEYAARAGSTTAYFFGEDANELGRYAWHKANSGGSTHPVAGKTPNQWGLYDMHGNVWEWVQDLYGDYPKGTATEPQGSETGAIRVRRGGGWMSTVYSCRSASRSGNEPDYKVFSVGFRLVCDPPVEKPLP